MAMAKSNFSIDVIMVDSAHFSDLNIGRNYQFNDKVPVHNDHYNDIHMIYIN